jgi:molybdate transport system substrate-binding protein
MLLRILATVLAILLAPPARAQDAPTIAAASDLAAALPEIAKAFKAKTGAEVRLTFGSSGAFTQQILNGAPYEVFLSADEAYVERLREAGKTQGPGALYGVGRIGLFVPKGSPLKADLKDIAAAARDGRLRRFAIANPTHAPYGRAAREALQQLGVWTDVEPKLVLGETASQATQFATSGGAEGGIIPLSLSMTPQVKAAGAFVLIPAGWHGPLRQRAASLKGAGPTALAFYNFLLSPEARKIFARYGFSAPG